VSHWQRQMTLLGELSEILDAIRRAATRGWKEIPGRCVTYALEENLTRYDRGIFADESYINARLKLVRVLVKKRSRVSKL
jgi:hypothetical protein